MKIKEEIMWECEGGGKFVRLVSEDGSLVGHQYVPVFKNPKMAIGTPAALNLDYDAKPMIWNTNFKKFTVSKGEK